MDPYLGKDVWGRREVKMMVNLMDPTTSNDLELDTMMQDYSWLVKKCSPCQSSNTNPNIVQEQMCMEVGTTATKWGFWALFSCYQVGLASANVNKCLQLSTSEDSSLHLTQRKTKLEWFKVGTEIIVPEKRSTYTSEPNIKDWKGGYRSLICAPDS